MLKLLPEWLKIGGSITIGAMLAFGPAYLYGKSAGRADERVAALTKSVEILRERNVIDEDVSSSDAANLCGSYGLSDIEQAECMRRVQQAIAEPGNVGNDPAN